MSTDGRMDEEDVVRVHNKLLISHKKKRRESRHLRQDGWTKALC